MKKQAYFAVMVLGCLVFMGCANPANQAENSSISSDIQNTTWTMQVNGSEVTIAFEGNGMTMASSNDSRYNGRWQFAPRNCCGFEPGFGFCRFGGGPFGVEFRYSIENNNDTLRITRSLPQSLNGDWTRVR